MVLSLLDEGSIPELSRSARRPAAWTVQMAMVWSAPPPGTVVFMLILRV